MKSKKSKIDHLSEEVLPDVLIPIKNSDKDEWSESWYKGRNLLNIPQAWRGVFIGAPGAGKSTAIKNIIVRTKPEFQQIILYHLDDNSSEWDDIVVKKIKEIPDPTSFNNKEKKLLILEDINLSNMAKNDKNKLNRLMGYCSSHCNMSIAITTQNAFDLSPSIRRMCNLFVIFRQIDINALITLASRCGLKSKHMLFIMSKLIRQPYDSFWIECIRDSPAPYRINGFQKVTVEQLDAAIENVVGNGVRPP